MIEKVTSVDKLEVAVKLILVQLLLTVCQDCRRPPLLELLADFQICDNPPLVLRKRQEWDRSIDATRKSLKVSIVNVFEL